MPSGRGEAGAGRQFLVPSYYSQSAVFASLSAFFIRKLMTDLDDIYKGRPTCSTETTLLYLLFYLHLLCNLFIWCTVSSYNLHPYYTRPFPTFITILYHSVVPDVKFPDHLFHEVSYHSQMVHIWQFPG